LLTFFDICVGATGRTRESEEFDGQLGGTDFVAPDSSGELSRRQGKLHGCADAALRGSGSVALQRLCDGQQSTWKTFPTDPWRSLCAFRSPQCPSIRPDQGRPLNVFQINESALLLFENEFRVLLFNPALAALAEHVTRNALGRVWPRYAAVALLIMTAWLDAWPMKRNVGSVLSDSDRQAPGDCLDWSLACAKARPTGLKGAKESFPRGFLLASSLSTARRTKRSNGPLRGQSCVAFGAGSLPQAVDLK
jgi:hypothetical protein